MTSQTERESAPTSLGEGGLVPAEAPVGETPPVAEAAAETFIGPRGRPRMGIESAFVRLVATSGIVGIAVGIAAILGSQGTDAWVIGLVASGISVVLAAVLWSSRTL